MIRKIFVIIVDLIFHNFKFIINRKNFFFLFLIKKVIFFDKKKQKIFFFNIRSFYDYITIKEIFLSECYSFKGFKKEDEINRFYQSILNKSKIPLILDLGANIGASSSYFFFTYPGSKIVSLEPDIKNYETLKKNVPSSIIHFNKAIACEQKNLKLNNSTIDPRAIAVQYELKGEVECVPVNKIINDLDDNFVPFIIKIDIEGGEKDLFKKNTEWIDKFKIIIIEPHDWLYEGGLTMKNFLNKIGNLDRDFIILNENIVSIKNNRNIKV
jgi:FkbM family methyltransferase